MGDEGSGLAEQAYTLNSLITSHPQLFFLFRSCGIMNCHELSRSRPIQQARKRTQEAATNELAFQTKLVQEALLIIVITLTRVLCLLCSWKSVESSTLYCSKMQVSGFWQWALCQLARLMLCCRNKLRRLWSIWAIEKIQLNLYRIGVRVNYVLLYV